MTTLRIFTELSAPNAADLLFVQITSLEPTPGRRRMIQQFCQTFWGQLSENHRNAYRECYSNPETIESPLERQQRVRWSQLGDAAHDALLAAQDDMLD